MNMTGLLLALALSTTSVAPTYVPTGAAITPLAAPGAVFQTLNPELPTLPDYVVGQASGMAVSPDGRTLAILTSGFNRNRDDKGKVILAGSSEFVFLYDIAGDQPRKLQALSLPNAFIGLAWSPDGGRLYASGGVNDTVAVFARDGDHFVSRSAIPLGHKGGLGLKVQPETAGLSISADGRVLLAANLQNDSVSLVDLAAGKAVSELDLRPGAHRAEDHGKPGGTFPRGVAFVAAGKAYVSSLRDRELVVVGVSPDGRLTLEKRIRVAGQPNALVANPSAGRLYVALDNTDRVAVLDTRTDRVIETFAAAAPVSLLPNPLKLGGAGTNALTLSPDGRTLLVSDGGENAVAVVRLSDRAAGVATKGRARDDDDAPRSEVVGLIPTGWYPTAVAMRGDGRQIYVINGKSDPGPNVRNCRGDATLTKEQCQGSNQYVWQLEKAGFLTLPTPAPAVLGQLSRQVAENNRFLAAPDPAAAETMAFLRTHIRHVLYIVKENRTYDQILGDLQPGNGDPRLTLFPQPITPNHHALARNFVTLDNFLDSGESSNTGWNWSTAGRTTDFTEREAPVNYGARGLQYDQEGANRNVNMAYATSAERRAANPVSPEDPDILPGVRDVAAPDGPNGREGGGYLWDAALAKGLSVRNYGFYEDLVRYEGEVGDAKVPLEREPWKTGLTVAFPTKASLLKVSDPYFRSFDQAFPDYYRFQEWKREYDAYAAKGEAPRLTLLRINHDHFGSFKEAIDGINTVETQMADNDYALGLVAEAVAKGPFAKDTLIFVLEDDAQDGADHVNAHRSVALVIGPYVKQGAVISKRYTTVNVIRTMVDVLGVDPLGLNDAMAEPMSDVFDVSQASWTYHPLVPPVLRSTALPLPPAPSACVARPKHSARYWATAMAGQDFSSEDRLDTAKFNRALWKGLKGPGASHYAGAPGCE